MAPSRPTQDYYAVLNLPQTATLQDIVKNYKALALERHQDRAGGSTAAFQLVSALATDELAFSLTQMPSS